MANLGVTEDGLFVYEGAGRYGTPVWPTPVVIPATVIESAGDWKQITPSGAKMKMVFREDSFDAVTRVRRGRLYDGRTGTQPSDWIVRPHPAMGGVEEREAYFGRGGISKRLDTFDLFRGLSRRPDRGTNLTLALGTLDAFSVWRVVAVERVNSGEDLLTLRARSMLGVLPELDTGAVPASALPRLTAALSTAVDAAFREGPASIIDRCKDAGAVALGHWLAEAEKNTGFLGKDIGALYQHLESKHGGPRMLTAVARVLGFLHANAKPNEQHNHRRNPPGEGDAELAIAALGTLLQELGWARP